MSPPGWQPLGRVAETCAKLSQRHGPAARGVCDAAERLPTRRRHLARRFAVLREGVWSPIVTMARRARWSGAANTAYVTRTTSRAGLHEPGPKRRSDPPRGERGELLGIGEQATGRIPVTAPLALHNGDYRALSSSASRRPPARNGPLY